MPRRPPSGSLRQFGEFALIERFRRQVGPRGSGVLRGVGEDDAAIIRVGRGRHVLLTTDLLAEGIHFDLATAAPLDVGYKAAISNISDVAAMGGIPQYMLVALAIPEQHTVVQLDQLYRGVTLACRRHGMRVVGGDTSASRRGLFLCITVIGTTGTTPPLTRAGARVGDRLYVTGTVGDSHVGLRLLTAAKTSARPASSQSQQRHLKFLVARHLRPTARVREARLLATHRLATAALDLSDGLSGDLQHLCRQSKVGAEVSAGSLPLSPACRWYAGKHGLDATQVALTGGEDYELLFTVSKRNEKKVQRLAKREGFQVTPIGTIRPRAFGVKVRTVSGPLLRLVPSSYQHFVQTKVVSRTT